jgi:hypothetical protein
VRVTDDPSQGVLITADPDLSPLRAWVLERIRARPYRWKDLIEAVRAEVWRKEQLNDVVRKLRSKERVIGARGYEGHFAPKNNPELFMRAPP